MFDLTISETWTTPWGTKCGPPKLDHCNAPLYGYLTALWKGYSTSKWKKLPQLRKEANKDKYRFSSKLTDALNEEKSLCLARNLDKSFWYFFLWHSALSFFDITGEHLLWLQSYMYLSDLMQYVSIDGGTSVKHPFRCGVPQGSVLGPILHLLYTLLLLDIKKKLKLSFYCYHTSICPSSQLYLVIGI